MFDTKSHLKILKEFACPFGESHQSAGSPESTLVVGIHLASLADTDVI